MLVNKAVVPAIKRILVFNIATVKVVAVCAYKRTLAGFQFMEEGPAKVTST